MHLMKLVIVSRLRPSMTVNNFFEVTVSIYLAVNFFLLVAL